MNFKSLACQNLRDYRIIRAGVNNLRDELETLNDKITDIAVTYNPGQSMGGGGGGGRTSEEERMLIAQDRYAILKPAYDYKRKEIDRIKRALLKLTKDQRLILARFHIKRPDNLVEVLCAELHVERSQLYVRHDEALRAFTKALYAIVDG